MKQRGSDHSGILRTVVMSGLLLFTTLQDRPASAAEAVPLPDWFKTSFLDLRADLEEARASGKTGIMLFFHSPSCSYCHAFLRTTLADTTIVERLRDEFDVVDLNVFSDAEVTDFNGKTHWVKDFAVKEKARFTPTLVFYGKDGQRLVRLTGYYPPKKFRGVLGYLEQEAYESQSLRAFLAQRDQSPAQGKLPPDDPLFADPPYVLDRRLGTSDRPLLLLFERTACDPCERFHRIALQAPSIRHLLEQYEVVRLDMNDSSTKLLTPSGGNVSARQWADELGLLHAPSLVFFDQQGREVMRVDSELLIDAHGNAVTHRDPEFIGNIAARLRYVLEKGYDDYEQFQQWRRRQGQTPAH